MKTKLIYLDSCIFVAYFMKEEEKIKKINKFFKKAKSSKIKFFTSDWTLTEIVKVLMKDKKISSEAVANYIQELQRTKRLNKIKFLWISVSKKKDYDFEEFCYEVQKMLLEYQVHLGDAIHALIMKNNKINTILTIDSKFMGAEGMIIINPLKEGNK